MNKVTQSTRLFTAPSDMVMAILDNHAKALDERDALRQQVKALQDVTATALRTIESKMADMSAAQSALNHAMNLLDETAHLQESNEAVEYIRAAILLLEGDK